MTHINLHPNHLRIARLRSVYTSIATCILLYGPGNAFAEVTVYDLVDGLTTNRPVGATGGAAVQSGYAGWWFKYEPLTPWGGLANGPIARNPSDFLLLDLGRDGSTGSYGWAANAGSAINDRGVVRNGNWPNRGQQNGESPGDALFANAENNAQLVIEWQAPVSGMAAVAFEFNGADHAEADLQWHIGTWDGASWIDHGFVVVRQTDTPAQPAQLTVNNLPVSAGDSIYLYGHVYDHDAFDGTLIRGGISLSTEPTDLAFTRIHLDPVSDRLALRWTSRDQVSYDLLYSNDPTATFNPSVWSILTNGVFGTGSSTEISLPDFQGRSWSAVAPWWVFRLRRD
ncbi:MAG: hypothetical protein ACI9TH_004905 [Kiritimatiellia bacterium]|jgi:hypothetical protein